MKRSPYISVMIACVSPIEARRIVRALLGKRLIACGQIIAGVESYFRWRGAIDTAREALIIAKTRRTCFKKIAQEVAAIHSYEVPEIIALPIVEGKKSYLAWIDENTYL